MANFSWNARTGLWSLAADWVDTTSPGANAFPGASDTATITAPSGTIYSPFLISGPVQAATLAVTGDIAFDASASFGQLTAGSVRYPLDTMFIGAGAVISAGTANLIDTVLINGPGAALTVAGTVSEPSNYEASYYTLNGGALAITNFTPRTGTISFYADASSTVEIGGGSIATAGTIAIDANTNLAVQDAGFYSAVRLMGTLDTSLGLGLFDAPVTGTGTIDIAAGTTFDDRNSSIGAGISIVFLANTGNIALYSQTGAFTGTIAAGITGFQMGNSISTPREITAITVASASASQTTLNLLAGAAVEQTLTLDGNYLSQSFVFLKQPISNGLIELASNAATTPVVALSGGQLSDTWNVTTTGGSWDNASNWLNTSVNQYGVDVPGIGGSATITNTGSFTPIINGNGTPSTLTVTGQIALNGTLSAAMYPGGFTGPAGGSILIGVTGTSGLVDVLSGSSLTGSFLSLNGYLQVEGTAAIAGLITGNTAGFVDGIGAYDGGVISTDGLYQYNGTIEVDGLSAIEIGYIPTPVLGAVNVARGYTVSLTGSRLYGDLVNAGTLIANVGRFSIQNSISGNVSGPGLLEVSKSSLLHLNGSLASSSVLKFIDIDGTFDISGATAPLVTASGFVVTDEIDVSNSVVGVQTLSNSDGTVTLTLTNAAGATVQQIVQSGSLAGNAEVLLANPFGGSSNALVLAAGTLQAGAAPTAAVGSSAGQSFTEAATGGAWNATSTWAAALAPGSNDTVTLGSSGSYTVLSGSGNAALVRESNGDALSGVFNFNALQISQVGGTLGTAPSLGGWLDVTSGSTLTLGSASINPGTLEAVGAGASIVVNGVLSMGKIGATGAGNSSNLFAAGGGTVRLLGGVAMLETQYVTNQQFAVDAMSAIEIGTAGGAARGAITVDAGQNLATTVSGTLGTVNFSGNVVNNGTIGSATLENMYITGSVSGTGVVLSGGFLQISGAVGPGQTIEMTGTASVLELMGGQINSPVIAGFSSGQQLQVQGSVTKTVYTSTGSNSGTLAFYDTNGTSEGSVVLQGNYSGQTFLVNSAEEILLAAEFGSVAPAVIELAAPCFVTGTRIATRRGEVAVEDLVVGDVVQARQAGWAPVIWIGRRRVECARAVDPREVWPVLIEAHAFGPNEPCRDLWVSPDHAVAREDVLIPAWCLVNGESVRQIEVERVDYWHIELPGHDVILAENLPVESFLDCDNRSDFDGSTGIAPLVCVDAAPCLPVMRQGVAVERVRAMLRRVPIAAE